MSETYRLCRLIFFCCKHKTSYDMRIGDWSSDVCSSDLWTPYCGAAPAPGEWIARWNLDPVLLAAFVFGIAFYFLRSRQPENRQRYFGIGIAVLAFLFISPFCALTSALFSARTAHHIFLTAIAAPLLVSSMSPIRLPGGLACWAFAHIAIFWLWHLPSAYAWALGSDAAYWFMQIRDRKSLNSSN